jgi:hypothetical protein
VSNTNNNLANRLFRNPTSVNQIIRILSLEGDLPTSSGGILQSIISLSPGAYSDWSAISPLYDEFRQLAAEITIFCAVPNVTNTIATSRPVVLVYDNDDNTAQINSYSNGMDYNHSKYFSAVWDNTMLPKIRVNCWSQGNPATGTLWSSTGLPNAFPRSFKLYANSLTASTTYLSYIVRMAVGFRGAI